MRTVWPGGEKLNCAHAGGRDAEALRRDSRRSLGCRKCAWGAYQRCLCKWKCRETFVGKAFGACQIGTRRPWRTGRDGRQCLVPRPAAIYFNQLLRRRNLPRLISECVGMRRPINFVVILSQALSLEPVQPACIRYLVNDNPAAAETMALVKAT
jgi:hypothetical protein